MENRRRPGRPESTPPEIPREPERGPVAWEAVGPEVYQPRRIRGSWVGGALG
jgi:hypothetical protein